MNKKEFIKELEKLNITLTDEQIKKLNQYKELLIEKNKVINLTTITKEEDIYLKHFYDSLTITKLINLTNQKICDLGTGAGFPGIVLKIVYPDLNMTLVDSVNKKVEFLKEVIDTLKLQNIEALNDRIEHFSQENKEKYDILVTRAVSQTNKILELGCQALKQNGHFILMKGEVEEELKEASNAIKTLNFKLIKKIKFNLPIENSIRTLIDLQKIDKTSDKYPRDFTKIKKKPL